jgi:hypothetical protein
MVAYSSTMDIKSLLTPTRKIKIETVELVGLAQAGPN